MALDESTSKEFLSGARFREIFKGMDPLSGKLPIKDSHAPTIRLSNWNCI